MCTNPDQQGKNDQHLEIPPGSSDVGDIDKEVPTGSETLLANTTSSTESSNGKVDYGKLINDDGVDLDTQCASNHLVHNDGVPEDIRKSFISSLRCIVSSSCHQHKIAAVYYQARHNLYIFLPTQILALTISVLGFTVSTTGNDGTNNTKVMGLILGVMGALSVFIQAFSKSLNWEGEAAMHRSCVIQLQNILQSLLEIEMSDPISPGLFDKSYNDVLHLTKREEKSLQKVESDFNTACASCRSLIPIEVECAFTKIEAELVMWLSPEGSNGSLIADGSSYLLLESCYSELAIVLLESIRFPKMRLLSAYISVTKAFDAVKARLKAGSTTDLTEYFPHSTRIKNYQLGQNPKQQPQKSSSTLGFKQKFYHSSSRN